MRSIEKIEIMKYFGQTFCQKINELEIINSSDEKEEKRMEEI